MKLDEKITANKHCIKNLLAGLKLSKFKFGHFKSKIFNIFQTLILRNHSTNSAGL